MSSETIKYTGWEDKKRQELLKAISTARAAKATAEAKADEHASLKEGAGLAAEALKDGIATAEEALCVLKEQLAALGISEDPDQWVKSLTVQQIEEARKMRVPPKTLEHVLAAVYILLNTDKFADGKFPAEIPWKETKAMLSRSDFLQRVVNYNIDDLVDAPHVAEYISANFLPPELEPPALPALEPRSPSSLGPASAAAASPTSTLDFPAGGPQKPLARAVSDSSTFLTGLDVDVDAASSGGASSADTSPLSPRTALARASSGPAQDRKSCLFPPIEQGKKAKAPAGPGKRVSSVWQKAAQAVGEGAPPPGPRRLSVAQVAYASKACAGLFHWCAGQIKLAAGLRAAAPLRNQRTELRRQLKELEAELKQRQEAERGASKALAGAEAEVKTEQKKLEELEAELSRLTEAAAARARAEEAAAEERERERLRREAAAREAERLRREEEERTRRAVSKPAELTRVDVVIKQRLEFEKGETVVDDKNIDALLGVVEVMRDNPQVKVNVESRADASDGPDPDFQVQLSRERAQAVCDWMQEKGGVMLGRLRTSTVSSAAPASRGGSSLLPLDPSQTTDDWHVRFHVIQEIQIHDKLEFGPSSSALRPDSLAVLDSVANVLRNHRSEIPSLNVEGHTCSQGPDAWNMALSVERAKSVVEYLQSKGIPSSCRLEPKGYGLEKPLETNDTRDGRYANRRVEFLVNTSS